MRILNLIILTIFAGSVFLTSGKFVNETNTPKLYFVVSTLLVIAAFIAIRRNRLNFEATPKSRKARHCEVQPVPIPRESNLMSLVICILRLLHFVRNDEKPLVGADSTFESE